MSSERIDLRTNESDQWSSQSTPPDEILDVDLRAGQFTHVPMANGTTVLVETFKSNGRLVARFHRATRERPIRRAKVVRNA